jgi:hypothetical protein
MGDGERSDMDDMGGGEENRPTRKLEAGSWQLNILPYDGYREGEGCMNCIGVWEFGGSKARQGVYLYRRCLLAKFD